jgi:hypothetical protein
MSRPSRFADTPNIAHEALVYYDFATDGGGIGTITLPGVLPSGAVLNGGFYNVLTTLESATDAATLALRVQSAGDLKEAVAIDDAANPYDAGTVGDLEVSGGGALAIKLTADRQVQVVIAVEALTAGRIAIYLSYVVVPSSINE